MHTGHTRGVCSQLGGAALPRKAEEPLRDEEPSPGLVRPAAPKSAWPNQWGQLCLPHPSAPERDGEPQHRSRHERPPVRQNAGGQEPSRTGFHVLVLHSAAPWRNEVYPQIFTEKTI